MPTDFLASIWIHGRCKSFVLADHVVRAIIGKCHFYWNVKLGA